MEDRGRRRAVSGFFEQRIARLEQRAETLSRLGDYRRSVELLEEACLVIRRGLGDRLPLAIPRYALLAEQCRRIGEGDKPEPRRRLAALQGSAEGFDAMSYARTLNSLGVLRCELAEHEKALKPFSQALEIARRHCGDASLSVAVLAINLAGTRHELGHQRQAEGLYLEALRALGRCNEPVVLETVYCLCSLADLRILAGSREGALELADRAVQTALRFSGADPEELAEGLARLADLYYRLGEVAQALELLRQSARKLEEAGRPSLIELHRCLDRLMRLENRARSWTGVDDPTGNPERGDDP